MGKSMGQPSGLQTHACLRTTPPPQRIQYSNVHRLEFAYSRLRLRKSGLKENNLFHSEADPICSYCKNELESTQNFLLDCPEHVFFANKI